MNNEKIKKTFSWLQDQLNILSYGEIGIKVIIHDGQIRRIEKTFTEKTQE